MHSESECLETKDVKVFIITELNEMFDIILTCKVRSSQISFYNGIKFCKIWMDNPIEG